MSAAGPPCEVPLLEYAYGELSAPEEAEVERHLAGCAGCAASLAAMGAVRRTMSGLGSEPAPEAGLESLLAYAEQSARRASEGPSRAPSGWRRWMAPLLGAGAVAVLALVALPVARQASVPLPSEIASDREPAALRQQFKADAKAYGDGAVGAPVRAVEVADGAPAPAPGERREAAPRAPTASASALNDLSGDERSGRGVAAQAAPRSAQPAAAGMARNEAARVEALAVGSLANARSRAVAEAQPPQSGERRAKGFSLGGGGPAGSSGFAKEEESAPVEAKAGAAPPPASQDEWAEAGIVAERAEKKKVMGAALHLGAPGVEAARSEVARPGAVAGPVAAPARAPMESQGLAADRVDVPADGRLGALRRAVDEARDSQARRAALKALCAAEREAALSPAEGCERMEREFPADGGAGAR